MVLDDLNDVLIQLERVIVGAVGNEFNAPSKAVVKALRKAYLATQAAYNEVENEYMKTRRS